MDQGEDEQGTCEEDSNSSLYSGEEEEETIKEISLEPPFKCDHKECTRAFTTAYHLRRHMGTVHVDKDSKKAYLCPELGCGRSYSSSANLKRHMKTHEDPLPYKCDVSGCYCSFKKRAKLLSHLGWTHKLKPFKCDEENCSASFDLPSELKRHKKSHKEYPCSVDGCKEVCLSWSLLRKHIASSHKKNQVCEECNSSFRTPKQLELHKAVHSESRLTYQCDREGCSRSYTTMFNLKQHIQAFHDRHRPFSCHVDGCDSSFAHKHSLMRHMNKMHSSEDKSKQESSIISAKKKKKKPRGLSSLISGHIVSVSSQEEGVCPSKGLDKQEKTRIVVKSS